MEQNFASQNWGILYTDLKVVEMEPSNWLLGINIADMQATVYSKNSSGICAAFLSNKGRKHAATVQFNGNSYHLPAWSVGVLPDCKNVVYNTAKFSDNFFINECQQKSRCNGQSYMNL